MIRTLPFESEGNGDFDILIRELTKVHCSKSRARELVTIYVEDQRALAKNEVYEKLSDWLDMRISVDVVAKFTKPENMHKLFDSFPEIFPGTRESLDKLTLKPKRVGEVGNLFGVNIRTDDDRPHTDDPEDCWCWKSEPIKDEEPDHDETD